MKSTVNLVTGANGIEDGRLGVKCDESKATRAIGGSIYHNHTIPHNSVLGEVATELLLRDVSAQSSHKYFPTFRPS